MSQRTARCRRAEFRAWFGYILKGCSVVLRPLHQSNMGQRVCGRYSASQAGLCGSPFAAGSRGGGGGHLATEKAMLLHSVRRSGTPSFRGDFSSSSMSWVSVFQSACGDGFRD